MLVRIDGEASSPEALCWPAMNWGQFRWDAPLGEYELAIPRKVFVDAMTGPYAILAADLRYDDEMNPEDASFLCEIGYPPLNVALDHPQQADELIGLYLLAGVLDAFVPAASPSARFMMNSVDTVSVTADAVVLRGRGYHLPTRLLDGGPAGH